MSHATKTVSLEALGEIQTLQRCFSAVAELINPEKDLHAVSREDLATLMLYLSDRMADAARRE